MAAFDENKVSQAVRELAVRHEQLHERLSRAIGPVADYHEMSLAQLAQYGLGKLGIEPPDAGDDPSVVALENFLHGRAGKSGMVAGMDAGEPSFIDRYLESST